MTFVPNHKTARRSVVWRYLPGSKTKHALRIDTLSLTGHAPSSLCGRATWDVHEWCGTGSQAEYDAVDAKRECRSCATQLEPVTNTVAVTP